MVDPLAQLEKVEADNGSVENNMLGEGIIETEIGTEIAFKVENVTSDEDTVNVKSMVIEATGETVDGIGTEIAFKVENGTNDEDTVNENSMTIEANIETDAGGDIGTAIKVENINHPVGSKPVVAENVDDEIQFFGDVPMPFQEQPEFATPQHRSSISLFFS